MADEVLTNLKLLWSLGSLIPPGSTVVTGVVCVGGGSGTSTQGQAADGSTAWSISLTSCNTGDGFVWSGTVVYRILSAPGAAHAHTQEIIRLLSTSGATSAVTGTVDTLDTTPSGGENTDTWTANLLIQDGASGAQVQLQNLALASLQYSVSGWLTLSGRVFDSANGYVDVSTDSTFSIPSAQGAARIDNIGSIPLLEGQIHAQGSASSLWIAPLTSVALSLELDPAGTGQPTQSVLLDPGSSLATQLAMPVTQPTFAAAGPALPVTTGQPAALEGRFSGGTSRAWTYFKWHWLLTPPGSQAALLNPTSPTPTFTPDLAGMYLATLTASDGSHVSHDSVAFLASSPSTGPAPATYSLLDRTYLGPDISLNPGDSYTPSTQFSLWSPFAPVQLSFQITDSNNAPVNSAQGPWPLTFPGSFLYGAGLYTSKLTLAFPGTTVSSTAVQYASVGTPLRYFAPADFRTLQNDPYPVIVAGLAAGDLSGTGHMDVVDDGIQTSPQGNQFVVAVYRNVGIGQYATPQLVQGGNGGPLALGDFNGDGRLDIAVDDNNSVDLLLQQPDGSWSAPQQLIPPSGSCTNGTGTHYPVAADFNHDGRMDLAFVNPCNRQAIDVFFQNPDGTFTPVELAAPAAVSGLITGDVTGDGLADLIAAVPPASTADGAHVVVYPATSGMAFGTPVAIQVSNAGNFTSPAMAVGDYYNTGHAVLVVAVHDGFYLVSSIQSTPTPFPPTQLAPAQVPPNSNPLLSPDSYPISHIDLQDVDGDGQLDVVAYSGLQQVMYVLRRGANGNLGLPEVLYPGQTAYALSQPVFADLDGDGVKDAMYVGGLLSDPGGPAIVFAFHRPH